MDQGNVSEGGSGQRFGGGRFLREGSMEEARYVVVLGFSLQVNLFDIACALSGSSSDRFGHVLVTNLLLHQRRLFACCSARNSNNTLEPWRNAGNGTLLVADQDPANSARFVSDRSILRDIVTGTDESSTIAR